MLLLAALFSGKYCVIIFIIINNVGAKLFKRLGKRERR